MPATIDRRWSEDEVRRLIEHAPSATPRYELVDGELLVTPGPSRMHQRIVLQLVRALADYVEAQGVGEVLTSPSDVRLAPELVVQPDLYVVPSTIPGRRPRAEGPVSQLTLAVEVLSPGSARYDRIVKRRAYQAAGVQEYWIVDADACVVERWQPGDVRPDMLDAALEWTPPHASLPFRLDLRKFFSAVSDDPADAESGP